MTTPTGSDGATETRSAGVAAMLAGVAVALVLSGGALIVAAGGSSGGGALAAASAVGVAAADAAPIDARTTVSFELDDLDVRPGDHAVAAGGSVEVVNVGAIPHDLVIEGHDVGTPMLDPGESYTFDTAELEPGTYEVICTVPGHVAAGMLGTLTVVGAEGDAASLAAASDHGDQAATTAATTSADTVAYDPNAAPPDGFEARDPRLPPAPDQRRARDHDPRVAGRG
jgi:plastocyanin